MNSSKISSVLRELWPNSDVKSSNGSIPPPIAPLTLALHAGPGELQQRRLAAGAVEVRVDPQDLRGASGLGENEMEN